MIKESTEDKAAMFARILTDGLKTPEPAQVSEPAAAAASWNAPSMNMAAAMASLMMGSAAKEESTPTLSSDALRAAAEFAENKDQLKNLLAEARRVVAAMQPGPEKTQAEGVIAVAAGANPNTIRAVLDALKDMIEQARSKEASIDSTLAAREQAEAAREQRIRELREQAYGLLDQVDSYIDDEYKRELQEKEAARKAIEDEIAALEAAKKAGTIDAAGLARLNELKKEELPQARVEEAQAQINAAQSAGDNARAAGDTRAAEIADQAYELTSEQMAILNQNNSAKQSALSVLDELGASELDSGKSNSVSSVSNYDAQDVKIDAAHSFLPNIPKQSQQDSKEQNTSPTKPANNTGVTF